MADIKIGVDVDTRQAASEIKRGLFTPLDNVNDALTDVEHSSKGMADAIEQQSRKASRALKSVDDDGIKPASEGIQSFKEEAVANFSEVASSFTGDISQMADGVQGLTGGLASALTPGIGIPVAILGATAGAFLASWTASAEQSSARVNSMYEDMLESGSRFLSESFIQEEIKKIGEGADDAAGKFSDAVATARDIGVSTQTVLRAMVGDQQSIADVVDATNRKRQENLDLIDKAGLSTEDYQAKVDGVNVAADETISKFQTIITDTNTAAGKAATISAAFGTGNALLDKQLRKIQDIAAAMGGIGDKTIKISADTTGLEGALESFKGRTLTVNVNGQITKIGQNVW